MNTITLLANVRHADHIIRQYDFIDPTTDTAVWIGEDAAVEVPTNLLPRVASLAINAGWHALTGHSLQDQGIEVTLHQPDFFHPSIGNVEMKGRENNAWRVFADVLGVSTYWLDDEGNVLPVDDQGNLA